MIAFTAENNASSQQLTELTRKTSALDNLLCVLECILGHKIHLDELEETGITETGLRAQRN